MSTDFNLISELHDKTLVIKTDGYINNTGGEKIVQEFTKHAGVSKLILNLQKSKVVNSIGISHLIEIIEKLNHGNGKTTDRGPHKGGEILWQLKGYEKFKVWVLPTTGPPVPRINEENLLKRFYDLIGKLPFANRQF